MLSQGDQDEARKLYDDKLVVWHNHDRIDRNKAQSVALVGSLGTEYDNFAVMEPRVDVLPDGYAERCVFTGRHRLSGRKLSVEAMLRVWLDGGRITRIEEYTDRAQGAVTRPDGPEPPRGG